MEAKAALDQQRGKTDAALGHISTWDLPKETGIQMSKKVGAEDGRCAGRGRAAVEELEASVMAIRKAADNGTALGSHDDVLLACAEAMR